MSQKSMSNERRKDQRNDNSVDKTKVDKGVGGKVEMEEAEIDASIAVDTREIEDALIQSKSFDYARNEAANLSSAFEGPQHNINLHYIDKLNT